MTTSSFTGTNSCNKQKFFFLWLGTQQIYCFLGTCLIFRHILETQELPNLFIILDLGNMCLLSNTCYPSLLLWKASASPSENHNTELVSGRGGGSVIFRTAQIWAVTMLQGMWERGTHAKKPDGCESGGKGIQIFHFFCEHHKSMTS